MHYFNHPKVIQLHPLAQLLYLRAVGYCKLHLTDGHLSIPAIRSIAYDLAESTKSADLNQTIDGWVSEMEQVGLLERDNSTLSIHDFLEWNSSRKEVEYISYLRSESGGKGGRPKANEKQNEKQNESKVKAKRKQRITHSTEFIVQSSEIIAQSSEDKVHSSKEIKSSAEVKTSAAPKSAETWIRYSEAYQRRYGVMPVRNQTVNSQLCNLVKAIGEQAAPEVAAFYVVHNKPFYVQNRHPVNLLLQDATGLHTQWATGIKATTSEARNLEFKDNVVGQAERVIASMQRKGTL